MNNLFEFLEIEPTHNKTIIDEAIQAAIAAQKDAKMIETCHVLLGNKKSLNAYLYRLQSHAHSKGFGLWHGKPKKYASGITIAQHHATPAWQKILAAALLTVSSLTMLPHVTDLEDCLSNTLLVLNASQNNAQLVSNHLTSSNQTLQTPPCS